MNKLLLLCITATLLAQAAAQTIVNCNTNADCTNFDKRNQISCCYTLQGVSISTGQTSTQKLCDWTANPQYSQYATQLGFKSVSGSCSSVSNVLTTGLVVLVCAVLTMFWA